MVLFAGANMVPGRLGSFARVGCRALLSALLLDVTSPSLAGVADCHDVRTGRSFTIPVAVYSAAGEVLGDETPLARLCVGALRATYVVPVSDGCSGAFVVWIESAGEDCDLRLQHVGSDGAPADGWAMGGRSLCSARGTQTQPVVAPAAGGGLWAAWKDFRDAAASQICLARLGPDGAPLEGYPEGGLRISAPGEPASDPVLVADGEGGTWLVWQQGRSGSKRLRLAHYVADGYPAPGWTGNGREIATGTGDALHPAASAGVGGGLTLA